MTEKQYKLLKDLPGLKAGAVFELIEKRHTREIDIYECSEDDVGYRFVHFRIKECPDWFQPIQPDDQFSDVTKMLKSDEAGCAEKVMVHGREFCTCVCHQIGSSGFSQSMHCFKCQPHPSEVKEIEKIDTNYFSSLEIDSSTRTSILMKKINELIEAVNIINQQLRRERE